MTHFDSVEGSYQGIKFLTKDNVCQEVFLDTDKILKEIKDGQMAQNILSNKFQIKYVRFVMNGNKALQGVSENDFFQPRVTIVMDAQFPSSVSQQEKVIQTTVSQHNLNVE